MNLNKLLVSASLLVSGLSASAQVKWNLDNSHSKVGFSVSHLMISEVAGNFKMYDAAVETKTADNFDGASISFNVDVTSINTENEMRDKHLKSDDFFNAEKYPKIKVVGKSMKKVSDNRYVLTADLTIRNITKTVTFDVNYKGTAKDPYGNTKAGFKATTKINRFDYDLKWNTLTEAGGAVVGSEVTLVGDIQLALAK